MLYEVTIKEILSRTYTVDAKSRLDALDQIKEQYNNCEIVLDSDDHVSTDYFVKPLELIDLT